MTTEERRRLRAAIRIHDRLTTSTDPPPAPLLPLEAWRDLVRAARLTALAAERGWTNAAVAARADYRRAAGELTDRLSACLRVRAADDRRHAVQSPREIFADLAALEAEFGEVEIDLKEETLSITTDPVVLEGVDLGRFEIQLHWHLPPDSGCYSVIALDPNPAEYDLSTTHPHVQHETLCEGEGRLPILRALGQGRLLDVFLLVRGVLTTYNPGSAHVPLSRWHGAPCADCGDAPPEDESACCDRCGADLCTSCMTACAECDSLCCRGCREPCGGCEEPYCGACRKPCRDCGEGFCRRCLTKDVCEDCRGPEPDHEPPEEADETFERAYDDATALPPPAPQPDGPPAGAAVQPVRLGEAAVPA